ncbi:restriction endonuclease [Streptomyces sp. NPDC001928]|uniref:restriction endonuclease n=1 Tax=Streptomyces sp. NPDC001928 TaxID=3154404 RepID=UPI00332332F8
MDDDPDGGRPRAPGGAPVAAASCACRRRARLRALPDAPRRPGAAHPRAHARPAAHHSGPVRCHERPSVRTGAARCADQRRWRARQVGRTGDQGADVIAEHPTLGRLVVQAKHTTTAAKVGSPVLYQLKGTAGPVHRAHLAAVITNGTFTRDAQNWGERHQIHWVDRDRLRQWAEHGTLCRNFCELLPVPADATHVGSFERVGARARDDAPVRRGGTCRADRP